MMTKKYYLLFLQAITPLFLDITVADATAFAQIFSYVCSGLLSLVGLIYTLYRTRKPSIKQREES